MIGPGMLIHFGKLFPKYMSLCNPAASLSCIFSE